MRADGYVSKAQPRADHLSNDDLLEICFPVTGDSHLATCETCRSRYDDLVRTLEEIREEAIAEADAVFTSERLGDQRDRILRRLEHAGHSAEVVMFPARRTHEETGWRAFASSRRWIAAAAAAGLVAGVLVGRFVDVGSRPSSGIQAHVTTSAAPHVVAQPAGVTIQPADDELLVQIEDAVTSRRVVELQALDALTLPELREISAGEP